MTTSPSICKSIVWQYFSICENDEAKAECLVCKSKGGRTLLSRGGKQKKNFTTTNMPSHLQSLHPSKYIELTDSERARPEKRKDHAEENTTATMRKKLKNQMSLKESFDAGVGWDSASPPAKRVNKLIAEMIAVDNQPFMVVEDLGFLRLINGICPKYKVPSRHYFSDTVIPELVKRAEAAVGALLNNVSDIYFTSDIWTCSHNNNTFISLTGHWIAWEKAAARQSFVLQSSYFPGSHTGERIADKFNTMLEKWKLSPSTCHVVVTDNASNIANGVEICGMKQAPCFIHTLQLAIKDAITAQRSVTDMIAKSRKIVGHFHHSALACTRLSEIQADLGLPRKKLLQDVCTR